MSLQGKNIVVGVCGGIAAYKTATLVRLLVKERAEVQVVMTVAARDFIAPLTLATLSKRPVQIDHFDPKSGQWHNHVQLGAWADLFVIAPATANTLAKMAHGICDNLLLATYLSAKCPLLFAPAMDVDMWRHPATQGNVRRLQECGHTLIPPGHGELASGLVGAGRLAEPEEILSKIKAFFAENLPLSGKKALVSAGPTHEAIDPVRFIGNHSSGKMGYAIAEALAQMGAEVTLVSGPVALAVPYGVDRHNVVSAAEMLAACERYFDRSDIIVMSAAVADYRPLEVADRKIKKTDAVLRIELTKTADILATLGQRKTDKQTLVGFALETDNEQQNAIDKLKRKNLDFIVLNSMRDEGAGFAVDTNKVTIIDRNGQVRPFALKSKSAVARDICAFIVQAKK